MLVMTAHFYAKHNYYLMMANIHCLLTIAFPQVNSFNFPFSSLLSSKIVVYTTQPEKLALEKER